MLSIFFFSSTILNHSTALFGTKVNPEDCVFGSGSLTTSHSDFVFATKRRKYRNRFKNFFASTEDQIQIQYPCSYGIVYSVVDGVATIFNLYDVRVGECVNFHSQTKFDAIIAKGIVANLNKNGTVDVVLLSHDKEIQRFNICSGTNTLFSIMLGNGVLGRIINTLGEPIDKYGKLTNVQHLSILERKAPGIIPRMSVHESMLTGYKIIDSTVPIGRGQRELILGDRKTGKTAIAVDTIINQVQNNLELNDNINLFCIYVAIGQKMSTVREIAQVLEKRRCLKYTTIVAAGASEPAPLLYLAPYVGCTIGEFFRDTGRHAVVFYDDLSKHAAAYRQMSLLLRRPPGREAFPGDVFYLHSRLLERAAKLSTTYGAGSLTALPIIETQEGDISAYIPTNVISITDGQIFLDTLLFNQGIRPAINVGASVSRVGSKAQGLAMKKVAGSLKLELAQYREVLGFAKLGSDLDATTQSILNRGAMLSELLKQKQYSPLPYALQVLSLFAALNGFMDDLSLVNVSKFENSLFLFVNRYSVLRSLLFSLSTSFDKDLLDLTLQLFRFGFNK